LSSYTVIIANHHISSIHEVVEVFKKNNHYPHYEDWEERLSEEEEVFYRIKIDSTDCALCIGRKAYYIFIYIDWRYFVSEPKLREKALGIILKVMDSLGTVSRCAIHSEQEFSGYRTVAEGNSLEDILNFENERLLTNHISEKHIAVDGFNILELIYPESLLIS